MRGSAPDGSSPSGDVRLVESDVDFELYSFMLALLMAVLLFQIFVGCAAALPMGVAFESLGDHL